MLFRQTRHWWNVLGDFVFIDKIEIFASKAAAMSERLWPVARLGMMLTSIR